MGDLRLKLWERSGRRIAASIPKEDVVDISGV